MHDQIIRRLSAINRDGMPKMLDYLRNSAYFLAPASTKFHLSCIGGLATHSWNVYEALKGLKARHPGVILSSDDSLAICGLLHDLCKVGLYVRENKRVRTKDGQWVDEEQWVANDPYPLGHGEKSLSIAQEFIKLSEEESLAIRWHMGPWDAEGYSARKSMGQAMDMCPLVKAMMLADQTATWMMED